MQRPVEPQGGQGKVGVWRVYIKDTTAYAFLPLNSVAALPSESLSLLPYLHIFLLFSPFPLMSVNTLNTTFAFFSTSARCSECLAHSLSPLHRSTFLVHCCFCPLQFQMAHLVPLKPYAAPVPRSQSLCDQPTKTMSAFPTQDPSLTPTPRPTHSRELVRQNSDPTSETPAPQIHQIREDRGPWIRLPDVELPPKVRN